MRNHSASREPLGPWVMVNLGLLTIYLGVVSIVSVPAVVFAEVTSQGTAGWLRVATLVFVAGGIGCLPGLIVWLVLLAQTPIEWNRSKQRRYAVSTSPLVGVVWLVTFAFFGAPLQALLFGLVWPLGAGLVVRLRMVPRAE